MKPYTFCPNRACPLHYQRQREGVLWYRPYGYYLTSAFGRVQRYLCLSCGKTFSDQTYSLDYYAKKIVDYREIDALLRGCESISSMGRKLKERVAVIQNRLQRLGKQAIAVQESLIKELLLQEDLVADGFESFCGSQYFPCNLNLLVGKESQYLYMKDYVTLRRKGRMTEEQKEKRSKLEERWKAEPLGIAKSFKKIGERVAKLYRRRNTGFVRLYTDEHNQYEKGLLKDIDLSRMKNQEVFEHIKVSSKLVRDKNNPLFSVNYWDRELRKDLANFVRESTRYGRNIDDLMNRVEIYSVWHNYRKNYRVKKSCEDTRYHGEVAGIERDRIEDTFTGYYRDRHFFSHQVLSAEGIRTWFRMWENPFKSGNKYVPLYAGG